MKLYKSELIGHMWAFDDGEKKGWFHLSMDFGGSWKHVKMGWPSTWDKTAIKPEVSPITGEPFPSKPKPASKPVSSATIPTVMPVYTYNYVSYDSPFFSAYGGKSQGVYLSSWDLPNKPEPVYTKEDCL